GTDHDSVPHQMDIKARFPGGAFMGAQIGLALLLVAEAFLAFGLGVVGSRSWRGTYRIGRRCLGAATCAAAELFGLTPDPRLCFAQMAGDLLLDVRRVAASFAGP